MNKALLSLAAIPLCLTLLLAAGCGDDEGNPPPSRHGGADLVIPASVFVAQAPEGAQDLHVVKTSAKEGDTVVVHARVGGSASPFVSGRAAMMVAGMQNITACSDRPGDACETPWDFCCDTPEDIAANTATVQVVDADGRPLAADFRGAHGITHLTKLVVRGTVGPRPDPSVLVINADAIYVAP